MAQPAANSDGNTAPEAPSPHKDGDGGFASKSLDIEKGSLPPSDDKSNTQQVSWDGPDDPENPQNWSHLKRATITGVIGLVAFMVSLGSSIYTPAVFEIEAHFGVSTTAAILGLSLYVIGLAFGPIMAAPISETAGRNIVYLTTLPVFMLFTMGAGFSKSFGSFLVCRFFAGFFGGPVMAVGAGTAADMYTERWQLIGSVSYITWPFFGPSIGPIVGGFVVEHKGWRWTQWTIIFGSIAVLLMTICLPETYEKTILKRRAKKRGLPEPPKELEGAAAIKFLFTVTLIRPLHMLIFEPIVTFISIYVAFCFAVLFAFFEAYPIVFGRIYNMSLSSTGLTFLGISLGVLLATFAAIWVDEKWYQPQRQLALAAGKRQAAPEHRLYIAMIGSLGMPIALFWFGWTARTDISYWAPLAAGVPFAFGTLAIFVGTANYMLNTYGPLTAASAIAANGIARYVLAAVFPLFTVQMYTNLHVDWASSLLGFISLALLPIPWVLFKWGPKIRSMSRYDTVAE
ncbi:major facilitator superfamily domain-containing protein [Phyllosticta capitalensis]|uniref:major facilitator superfamily domain-containing protein n=1 Tax=Phyllosticta capitalensis TaxID=121624 RepID=UPI00312F168E